MAQPYPLPPTKSSFQRLENGLQQIKSAHLTLVTDLPPDAQLTALPSIFEAALPQWATHFNDQTQRWKNWQATLYVMQDRDRFRAYLKGVPEFRYGYQNGDQLFVVEPPSEYFRRHEMLHEGTHWFMAKLFGGAGPPWYMEGVAEQLATHRLTDVGLELNVIPSDATEVPYWGRLRLIQDDLENHSAPSLDGILNYSHRAHLDVQPYAWSWAAVTFFANHPRHRTEFAQAGAGPKDGSPAITERLRKSIGKNWPRVTTEWQAFAGDLGYGFDIERAIPDFGSPIETYTGQPVKLSIAADRGWQSSGQYVATGQKISVTATGKYSVGNDPKPWLCEPQGITLHYWKGLPLGMCVAAIADAAVSGTDSTQLLEIIPIGRSHTIAANRSGLLIFKINESPATLKDNSGKLEIELRPGKQ